MKKILAVILAAMMVLCCAAAFAEGEAAVQTGTYQVYNATGEKVTSLYLIDKISGTVSEHYAGEGLENGANVEVVFSAPAEEEGHGLLVLIFITESGYVGTFTTLSIEEAPITLLSAEAMTGATMITFKAPAAE